MIRKTPMKRAAWKRKPPKVPKVVKARPKKPRVVKHRKSWKRDPADFARIYGSKARVKWVNSLPCVAGGTGPIQNVHVIGGGGTAYKADAQFIVPMSAMKHKQIHDIGRAEFEKLHGIDLLKLAAGIERDWPTVGV